MGLAEVLHWPSGGASQRPLFGSEGGAGFAFQQRRRRRQRPAPPAPLAETAHYSTYSGSGGPYSPPYSAGLGEHDSYYGAVGAPGSPPCATITGGGEAAAADGGGASDRSNNSRATVVHTAPAAAPAPAPAPRTATAAAAPPATAAALHNCSPPSPPPAAFPSSVYPHARRLASSVSSSSSSSSPSSHRRRSSRSSAATAATMPEYRHIRSSSLSVPGSGNGGSPAARGANPASAAAASVMARSPPNTAHVPCKFFRQGACQAGNACPFSHDLGASSDNVCKYFAKGNCKFGPKCANIHVLPDGRRVNYGKNGFTIITSPMGNAPNSPNSGNNASALTTSLYQADQPGFPSFLGDDRQHLHAHHSLDNGHGESPYSFPDSSYGSPRDSYGLSPVNGKGLSVLDAPLPASFDSNGISNAARFPAAPWPSSVPNKFGLDSPTPSLSNAKDSRTSDTLKLLHTSAFGSDHLNQTPNSPPNANTTTEEYFGKRAMHSSRYSKPRMMSSSVPKANVDRDWEAEFAFGDDSGDNVPENYVPENLQDLLTPAEKARRGSMRGENDVSLETLSKYGSPIGSSPSRWGPLFQRQKEEEELARSSRAAASPFGHVGSPLRNSTLAQEMGADAFSSSAGGRPSSMRMGSDSMSVLSQQLQRSRLDDAAAGSSPLLHPASARTGPPPGTAAAAIGKDRAMERHVSTGSIGSSVTGRFTTPIDEEDPSFVFSMEEDDPVAAARMRKRASAGLGMSSFTSYAGAVTGKGQGEKSKEGGDASSTGQ